MATTRVANVIISNTQIQVALKLRKDHSPSSKDLMILVLTMLRNVRDKITAKEVVNKHPSTNINKIIKAININTGTIAVTISSLSNSSPPIQEELPKANSTAIHITRLQEEWSHHKIHSCNRVAINTRFSSQINSNMEGSKIIIKVVADSGKPKTNGITTTIGIEETIDPRHIEAVEVIINSNAMVTPLKIDSKA